MSFVRIIYSLTYSQKLWRPIFFIQTHIKVISEPLREATKNSYFFLVVRLLPPPLLVVEPIKEKLFCGSPYIVHHVELKGEKEFNVQEVLSISFI